MRLRASLIGLVLTVMFPLLSPTPAHADQWDQKRWDALTATNTHRANAGARPLTLSSSLNGVAQACAVEVAKYYDRTGQLAHCNGRDITTIASYGDRMPSGSRGIAENISASPDHSGAESIRLFLASSGHRTNLLNPNYNSLGIGIAMTHTNMAVYVHNYGNYSNGTPNPITSAPSTNGPSANDPSAKSALGDHTGDGIADMFGVRTNGDLVFHRGTKNGAMSGGTTVGSGWNAMTYLAQVDDVNGDKQSDLLARRGSDNSLWLYRSTGNGGLSAWKQVGSNWGGMDQIVPAQNLGGDANRFVVARRASDGALFRYTVTPNGLSGAAQIGKNWGGMQQLLSVGDFNGDKYSDLLAIRDDGTLWMYAGKSGATIGAGKQVGRGWDGFASAFTAGDLTGDGRADLVGKRSDGQVFAYSNNVGTWGVARTIMTGAQQYRLMA